MPDSQVDIFVNSPDSEVITLIGITLTLSPGVHSLGIDCNQQNASNGIDYDQATLKAVLLST